MQKNTVEGALSCAVIYKQVCSKPRLQRAFYEMNISDVFMEAL